MSATVGEMGRPKKKEPTEPLRLPQSVVKRIRRIAVHRGQDPGDFVSEEFGPALDRAEKKMQQEIDAERDARTEDKK